MIYSLADMRKVFEEGFKAGHGPTTGERYFTPEQIEAAWQALLKSVGIK